VKVLLLTVSILFVACWSVDVTNCCPKTPVVAASRTWLLEGPNLVFGTSFPISCKPGEDDGWNVIMLTARHVTKNTQAKYKATQEDINFTLKGGIVISVHVKYDASLVLFKSEEYIPIIQLTSEIMRVGEPVFTAGYQGGDFWITQGLASSRNRVSAPISPGSSGGPVLLPDGRAIAITTQIGTTWAPFGSSQLIPHKVLCVAIADIAPWLREHSVKTLPIPTSTNADGKLKAKYIKIGDS